MRTIQELEARLALIHAASFKNVMMLNWDSFTGSKAKITLNSIGNDFQLIVMDYKGSALVRLDSEPYFSLDGYHYAIPIPEGRHVIEVEFSPFLAFGEKVEISPGSPLTANRNMEALRLWAYGRSVLEFARATRDDELRTDLLKALSASLKEAPFESISKEQIALSTAFKAMIGGLDSVPKLLSTDVIPIYAEEQDQEKYRRALDSLKNSLNGLIEKYGKRGKMIALAHAHIDTAWLWPFEETRRKVYRTFSAILTLMERYNFNYIQSAAIYYDWIKEEPSIFKKVKEKIEEGKWILGAGWVEFDTQLISGESLARQLLYSQRFYRESFGRIAEILWLPDTFGFSPTLPQAAKLGGVKIFATHKVFWNDTNKFPYNVFFWIGPDNSKLTAIAFGHGRGGYNSDFTAESVHEQWQNWVDKDKPMLYSYGYGDGGGGPTEEMLLRAGAIDSIPILPKVSLTESLEAIENLVPCEEWRGELYLEDHRGVLTSHSKMKLLNRMAELALREAEIWATLAGIYDKDRISNLWKILLKDQFHDVLPGSSIREVYAEAYPEIEKVVSEANEIAMRAMRKIADEGHETLVFNSLPWDREDYIVIDKKLEGSQRVTGGYMVRTRTPSLGYAVLKAIPTVSSVRVLEKSDSYEVENKYFVIKVLKNGRISSIWDKGAGREVLKNQGNRIIVYENIPGWADAWNIENGYKETFFEINASRNEVVSNGPLMVSIRFVFPFRRSEIVQEIRMYSDLRRIDFKTTIRMKDRELLVKTWFDFDVNTDKAVSDVPFGVIERPTTKNTSWEKAKYEVAIQKWIDLSEHNYGVALLNDGKYGASLEGSSVGLSLTRTPIFPDPSTDLEEVTFTYSVYPHLGDWKEAEVLRKAYELNVPLRTVEGRRGERSFLKIDSKNIMLEAMKVSEDDEGVVLRFYEFYNARGKTHVHLPFEIKETESLDLLELNRIKRDMAFNKNVLEFAYHNREIITIKVRR